jgi:hypothetical protein
MTLIVGMNLGFYALLAADTRASYYPFDQPMQFNDEREKIRRNRMGIMTGMGLVDLLDAVKKRFEDEDPMHTDRVRQIIIEERAKVPEFLMTSPRVKQAVEHETCWMFTYIGADDLDSIAPDSFRLRLAFSHPHDDYALRFYPTNTGGIGFPVGVSDEAMSELQHVLNENLLPLADVSQFEANLEHNMTLAATIIRTVSAINNTVSPSFQIGVHHLSAGKAVSDVCTDRKLSLQFEH